MSENSLEYKEYIHINAKIYCLENCKSYTV